MRLPMTRWLPLLVGGFLLSWLGFVVHNLADLPGQTLLSAETLYPTVVYALLLALWFTPARKGARWATLVWTLLQLLGGAILSVLPLGILPFDPEQTVRHYLFHLAYGVTQLPLLLLAWRGRARVSRAGRVP